MFLKSNICRKQLKDLDTAVLADRLGLLSSQTKISFFFVSVSEIFCVLYFFVTKS